MEQQFVNQQQRYKLKGGEVQRKMEKVQFHLPVKGNIGEEIPIDVKSTQ